MTYRERRQAKAERLREWADKRHDAVDAHFVAKEADPRTHDWAFISQPGHISERARLIRADDRAHESRSKAMGMDARASGIEAQLDRSIYSDDPDAIEQLRERIAQLTAKRDRQKAENAAYRKGPAAYAAFMGITPEQETAIRERIEADYSWQRMPHPFLNLLTQDIARNQKRLDQLAKAAAGEEHPRYLSLRFGGRCRECGCELAAGANALYYRLSQGNRVLPVVPMT